MAGVLAGGDSPEGTAVQRGGGGNERAWGEKSRMRGQPGKEAGHQSIKCGEGGGQTIHTRCHPLRAAEAAASRRRKPPLLAAAASRRRMPPEPAAAAMQQVRSKPPLRREGPRGPVEAQPRARPHNTIGHAQESAPSSPES